jgi:hypothetical protein
MEEQYLKTIHIQIIRPSESTAETQPKLQPDLLRLSANFPILHRRDSAFLLSTRQAKKSRGYSTLIST